MCMSNLMLCFSELTALCVFVLCSVMELMTFAFIRERLEQFMPAALLDTRKEKKVAKAEWEQKIIAKYDKGNVSDY